ncbi:hypothetical protein ABT234_11670 [Streptomyces sp. NPDC001586]|uniref:hypothetical protein n=1 Tax=Streptomyces sp. NPDC001586 TaxID=3154387 RepID=UPI00331CE8DB
MTEPRGPIDAARQQNAERAQQPARKLLDQLSDRELVELYERAEKAERHFQLTAEHLEETLRRLGETRSALTAEADLSRRVLERVEQAEAAIARVRAAHLETADGRCSDCFVVWPCPDVCRFNGPPGCRNCDEYHSRPA